MSKRKDFINLDDTTPKASQESLEGQGVEAGYRAETVPGTEQREGVGITPAEMPEQKIYPNVHPEAEAQRIEKLIEQKEATPKPALEGMGEIVSKEQLQEANEPWWLSGEIEENGVKRLITMDDVLKADPSLKDSLKGGDFLYNILNYRQKKGLSALDPATFRTMLGKHSMDKTAKQEKRDKVRHFLADAIQPVTDVLKAAVAYGYGKAGRTFIPAGGKQEAKSLGDRLRDMERVRAAQQWDAWADTFKMKERERIAEEAAKRRAAETRATYQQQREDKMADAITLKNYEAGLKASNRTPKERVEDRAYETYESLIKGGMSASQAYEQSGLKVILGKNNKSGGSGKSKSSSGSTSKTTKYEVDGTPYTLSQLDAAVEHAWYAENGDDKRAFSDWFKTLNRKQKVDYLKAHSRVVE